MKPLLNGILTLVSVLFVTNICANSVSVQIKLKQAKNIYNAMTGPAVQNEGAAGHLYRTGKSIVCIYTNVDMDDSKGNSIPMQDPRRYVCKMQIDANGLALPVN